MNEDEDIDVEAELQEAELDERRQRIAKLEEKGPSGTTKDASGPSATRRMTKTATCS